MERFIICFVSFLCVINIYSQNLRLQNVFSKALEIVNEKNGTEKFKGQILKGKRNGMGVLTLKNKGYYIGDFYRDNVSGYGMYISTNDIIDNCDNCFVYVGNWKDGKKTGYGKCYNNAGEIIYQGQFDKDKPIDVYPSNNIKQSRIFSVYNLNNENSYIGESLDGKADGFGILVFANGDLWMSNFKDGKERGIGLYMLHNGEWQTINFTGEKNEIVSSSENYQTIDMERKMITKAAINDALGDFMIATQKTIDLAMTINKTSVDENNTVSGNVIGNKDVSTSTSNKKDSSQSNHSGSEVAAKNRDSNTYSNYESQLIKMNTYWESQYNDSQRKNIQKKMKDIRIKWENRGFQMFRSQWEDWNGNKK